MGNIFNDDFREFIKALNDNVVQYILVGGYAVIIHGYRPTTGDMDIWVKVDRQNYVNLMKAFAQFGLPAINRKDFFENDKMDVFSFGRPPVSIYIMKQVKGCDFDEAFATSQLYVEDNLSIRFIHLQTLLQAKKASGRYKDLDDIEKLS